MVGLWTFVRLTLLEAIRNRLLPLAIGLTLLYLGLIGWGASKIADLQRSPLEIYVAGGGLELVSFFFGGFMLALLAVFVPGHSTHQEAGQGLLQAMVARPIRRITLLLGRWLGSALILAGYVVLLSAGIIVAVQLTTGYAPPEPFLVAAMLYLQALTLLSLRVLFGTFLGTLASGIVPLLLYGLARMGGLVEAIGQALDIPSLVQGGIATSLLIPVDVLWRAASYFLMPTTPGLSAEVGGRTPFFSTTPLATPMLVWALFYIVATFGAAAAIFSRRDI